MGSNGITVESVLESVVRITEQRSRESLEQCLVTALIGLAGIRAVTIVSPLPRNGGILIDVLAHAGHDGALPPMVAHAPLSAYPLLARALQDGREIRAPMPDGGDTCCLPVANGDEVAAFLVVDSSDSLAASAQVVRAFAAVYGNFLALMRDSERDTLTGLKNRKTFDENINRAIAHTRLSAPSPADRRHHDGDEHHWLAIVDIDHFKRINDTYGHAFGDEVLLLFSALMRKVFRSEDLLFRFGGEEFVVVLAPTTAAKARQAFERLREMVEGFHFPQVGQVTTSVGFVRIDPDDIPATVVGQADEALYWAKRHGRNRVCWYDDLIAAGELKRHDTEGDAELFLSTP